MFQVRPRGQIWRRIGAGGAFILLTGWLKPARIFRTGCQFTPTGIDSFGGVSMTAEQAEGGAMARKGIPYSRFSGKRQEAGDSQRRQDALAEEAARAEGVELDRTITLSDRGISAYRGANWKRGDLGKFLDLVDAGIVA